MVAYRLTSVRSLARFLTEHSEIATVCQFKDKRTPPVGLSAAGSVIWITGYQSGLELSLLS